MRALRGDQTISHLRIKGAPVVLEKGLGVVCKERGYLAMSVEKCLHQHGLVVNCGVVNVQQLKHTALVHDGTRQGDQTDCPKGVATQIQLF